MSSSADAFGISAVSGFYGPGAWLSWLLITASCVIDQAFAGSTTTSRGEKAAHIFGLDLNGGPATANPLVAAANLLSHMPSVVSGTFAPETVARISAPLLVLRLFRVSGLVLLGVTCRSERPWRPGGWRLNRAMVLVLAVVVGGDAVVFAGVNRERWAFGLESRYDRVTHVVLQTVTIAWIFYFAAKRLGFELRYQQAAFLATLLAWALSFCAETAFDMAYGRALWSCYREKSCSGGMHLVVIFPTLIQSSSSHRGFEESLHKGKTYLQEMTDELRSLYEKKSFSLGDWRLVERNAGLLWLLEARPDTYRAACQWVERVCVSTSTLFMIYFWALDGWRWIKKSKKAENLSTKQRRFRTVVQVVWFATLSPSWLLFLLQPIDLALRIVALAARPGRFLPGTTASWTDLDQMAALILNGVIPLLYGIWRAVYTRLQTSSDGDEARRIMERGESQGQQSLP